MNANFNRRSLISVLVCVLHQSMLPAQIKIDQKGIGLLVDSLNRPPKPELSFEGNENLLSPEMVVVIGGTYFMGCTAEQDQGIKQFYPNGCQTTSPINFTDATPVRETTLTDFLIGKYEVSQLEWFMLMGNNPSFFSACGGTCPVTNVSWYGAAVFCNRLSLQEGFSPCYYSDINFTQILGYNGSNWNIPNSGNVYWKLDSKGYRLPTEAEWEYTARGGGLQIGNWYAGSSSIDLVSWFINNSFVGYSPNVGGKGTMMQGKKQSNELGLYDMSGNVFEWCYDWYSSNYAGLGNCAPLGPSSGSDRVMRGGAWGATAPFSLISVRNYFAPTSVGNNVGFRLARTP